MTSVMEKTVKTIDINAQNRTCKLRDGRKKNLFYPSNFPEFHSNWGYSLSGSSACVCLGFQSGGTKREGFVFDPMGKFRDRIILTNWVVKVQCPTETKKHCECGISPHFSPVHSDCEWNISFHSAWSHTSYVINYESYHTWS